MRARTRAFARVTLTSLPLPRPPALFLVWRANVAPPRACAHPRQLLVYARVCVLRTRAGPASLPPSPP